MSTLVKTNGKLFPANNHNPSFFDNFWDNSLLNWMSEDNEVDHTIPSVNVQDQDNSYEVELAAPGLKKENFSIVLENDTLSVSAQSKNEKEESNKNGRYTKREFSYHSFKRSFNIPEHLVNRDKISATYKDGILKIHIPKTKEALNKAMKQIEIK